MVNIFIVFAGETGNAEECAFALVQKIRTNFYRNSSFQLTVSDISTVNMETLKSMNVLVFVVSTTGEGEMPSSIKSIWKQLLLKALLPDFLSSSDHAIFGLGDSSYEKYNAAGRYEGFIVSMFRFM
jgi:sulfite reductase alpha subunit-like flavoprotein